MSTKGKTAKSRKSGSKRPASPLRRLARRASLAMAVLFLLLCAAGDWYVHHPRAWLQARDEALPRFVTAPLVHWGDRTGMLTDALGLTGHDAVYEFDEPAPTGSVFFAGAPVRRGAPAPDDVTVLSRGEFAVGWSPTLGRPVWAAYHVPPEARYDARQRPSFRKDRAVPSSPAASAYEQTGYDRGHMVPNRAIVTRFGPEAQAKTFLMSNIAPQRPALNRGPWREIEQRIADLWTARYGEIWVIVGGVTPGRMRSGETLSGTKIDVPECYYALIVAQDADGVRALAILMSQGARYGDFPVHDIVTIAELERLTGFDFLPDLPSFLARPLESDLPTRLWPVRLRDLLPLILLRFN